MQCTVFNRKKINPANNLQSLNYIVDCTNWKLNRLEKLSSLLFTLFFQFLPLNLQFFCNFSPKIAHFYNFFPKECNFKKFSTSVSKKYGESFSQFFHNCGKSQFFCRIFTYDTGREVSLEFSLV